MQESQKFFQQNTGNADFELSEEDVKLRYISPALETAGWNRRSQIRMEAQITDGQIIVSGKTAKRQKPQKADYLLSCHANYPLAVIEAKSQKYSVSAGIQQAMNYARKLDIPFAYSSNGTAFLEHDFLTGREKEIPLDKFPSPQELWERYKQGKHIQAEEESLINQPYYFQTGDKVPRYYQRIAINRTIEAIAKGQNRVLLVMATGTGKTYTAFQIVHRLWSSGRKKKILFLADRNILVDQAKRQDFKPFGNVMHKISNRTIDTAYEVYFALYQQLFGENGDEIYKTVSPDFFDLIIVDECHRGSAAEDSQWRSVLEYFSSATHIGLTATPKETEDISNITYFGDPVYTHSLKQGIEDGFLAPYKVIRVGIDIDIDGWQPEAGQTDVNGMPIADRLYTQKDFDRNIIIDDRTALVAKRITEYLKGTNRFHKTIVFCVDIEHADRMRQALINENADLVRENSKYVVKITGDDAEGKAELDNFIEPSEKYPVIVTTSQLLSTGVDCKTCQLIVIEKNINSMIEFKQIIGRGTRLKTDYDKYFFTIMDFKGATKKFFEPDFDGEPAVIYEPKPDDPIVEPDPTETTDDPTGDPTNNPTNEPTDPIDNPAQPEPSSSVYKPRVQGVEVTVLYERVQYIGKDGKLTTESITDFSKRNILGQFATLDEFIKHWNSESKKQAIIEELQEHGVLLEELRKQADKPELDDFDLICHIAYDKPPLTRAERANNVRKRGYLHKYSDIARKVIDGLLEKYMHEGIADLDSLSLLSIDPFRQYGAPQKIASYFGGRDGYLQAVKELQDEIYA